MLAPQELGFCRVQALVHQALVLRLVSVRLVSVLRLALVRRASVHPVWVRPQAWALVVRVLDVIVRAPKVRGLARTAVAQRTVAAYAN